MKRIEKLAEDWESEWHAQHGPGALAKDLSSAFQAGYRAALEDASEIPDTADPHLTDDEQREWVAQSIRALADTEDA